MSDSGMPRAVAAVASRQRDGRSLESVVDELCRDNGTGSRPGHWNPCDTPLPSRDAVVEMVEALRTVLFPGYFGASELSPEGMRFHVGSTLDRVLSTMQEQVKRGLCFACQWETQACRTCDARALEITRTFLARLPEVRGLLRSDVRAHYEGDPAALNPDEAIFCYPGVLALISHRMAHELYRLGVPLIPRMINEHAHSITGIDIHPGASIGEALFIDHGTGVVVGETSVIGDHVRIYQGVTLGAKSFPLDEDGNPIKSIPRHPIVEDRVIVYSGATILGRVTIGEGSIIGGNVWLTRSVPPNSRLIQTPARTEEFAGGAGI